LELYNNTTTTVNNPPNGVINTPPQGGAGATGDVTINIGDTVNLTGTDSDPEGDYPLSYLWSFGVGSGIPDSPQEDPGIVQFDNPGTFIVTFTVTDFMGLSDPTPDTRTITVINTADVSQITVRWDANTEPELAGYKVYYGTSSRDYDTVVDVSTQASYVLSNLVSDETYYITVTAYNTSNYESTYSNEVIYNVPTY
jgi:hypothetical protein